MRLQKLFFAHKVPKQMRFFDTSSVGYMGDLYGIDKSDIVVMPKALVV